jgi:ParB/RepB/Spo0J family partition protein
MRIVPITECFPASYDSRVKPGTITEQFKSSLKTKGQDYPCIAIRCEDGTYEVWDGRRRLRALNEIGADTVKILVINPPADPTDPREMRRFKLLAFRTNHERQELSGFETVMQIEEMAKEDFKNAEISRNIDVSEAYVSQIRAIFKNEMLTNMLKNNELGESAVNKAKAIAKIKDADAQTVLANTAKGVNMASFQSIISGYDAATDGSLRIAPNVVTLVARGELEPHTVDRLKALAKLRNFEQQSEMAKILAQRTAKALRIENPEERAKSIPTVTELEDWISALKRENAGVTADDSDTDEGVKYTFKPMSPTRINEAFETWTEKYKTAKKDEDPDPVKLAELRGVLKGIKLAGGFEKA